MFQESPFMQNISLEQQMQQQQQLEYLMQNDASFQNEKTLKLGPKSSLFKISPSEKSNKNQQQEVNQSTANQQQSLRTIERQAKISLQQGSLIRTNNRTNDPQVQQIRPQQQTSLTSLSPASYDPNNEPIYSNSSLFKPKQQMIQPTGRSHTAQDERRKQNGSILSLNHPSSPSPYVMYSLNSRDQTNLSLEQISMNPSIPSNTRSGPSQIAQGDQMMREQRHHPHRVQDRNAELDSSLRDLRDSSLRGVVSDPRAPFAGRRQSALSGSNHSIYNELQVPSASNFGSMKRKKKNDKRSSKGREQESGSSDGSGVVSHQMEFREAEYSENNVKIWSLQYIPQVFSVSNKKTAKV